MKEDKNKKDQPVKLLEHNYDGIQEWDHPLPSWWLQTFYWSIAFAIFYATYYELAGGPDQWAELKADMAPIQLALSESKKQGYPDEDIQQMTSVPERVGTGKKVFVEKCAACHGPQAQGIIGPNLTDSFWIHGNGKPGAIAKVISEGVPDKGMPSWGPLMARDELMAVAAYIVTLKDSHPAQAKAPQGEEQK
jgi:cytochrome c oxidase cbb3-type subunit 3